MSTEHTTDATPQPATVWTPTTGDRVVLASGLFEPFVKDGTLGTVDYAPEGWPILVRWDSYQINIGHEQGEVRLATPAETAAITVVTR